MQARARAAREEKGLKNATIAAALGCAAGTVGRLLNETPARATSTLELIFNYLCVDSPVPSGPAQVISLARQTPESAALLAALFEELAALLRSASATTPGRTRTPRP